MKQFVTAFGLGSMILLASCSGEQQPEELVQVTSEEGPLLTVAEDVHDFGQVQQNSEVVWVFQVSNTGNAPLIISDCEKTCGCTVPQCDKDPIMPGEKSEIRVTYDSTREGKFNKTVKVISNSSDGGMKILRIKGEVLPVAGSDSTDVNENEEG